MAELSDNYVFSVYESQPDIELDSVSFFNSNKFIFSRSEEGSRILFYLIDHNRNLAVAKFSILIIKDQAYSPWNAPYGSIECSRDIGHESLGIFIDKILEWLNKSGISGLKIVHYPDFYNQMISEIIRDCYVEKGIELIVSDRNQHLPVNTTIFASVISSDERRRLNNCFKRGFSGEMGNFARLRQAYELLVRARKRKGYREAMPFVELERMFLLHPDHYLLFTTMDKDKIIAATISIRINADIMYNFYHADHEDYLNFSPTVMSINFVYGYCQEYSIPFIDLGKSSIDGEINEGLYRFKRELGAVDSHKKKFIWTK